ncbi:sensor histidine kinase [Polaribacter atrinae]|uniref:sensor histidine kinase n=1 Tax=Polaribacter atrinae TaxID=1333662 RepID=UPI0030F4D045
MSFHLTEKDGLPDIEFYSMIEDLNGFIWFASDKGLHRYDGKSFKQFSHPDKKGRSLFNLKLGPKGNIWCNNVAGQFFYVNKEELVLFKDYHKELKGYLADYNFFNNRLLIKKRDSISFINIDTKKLQKKNANVGTTSIGISLPNEYLFLDKNNNVVLLDTFYKTTSFSFKNKENLKYFTHFFKFKNLVFIVFRDNIFNGSQLFLVDKHKKETVQIKLPKEIVNSKIERVTAINNTLYLTTNKGIFVTSYKNKEVTIKSNYLKNETVTDVIKDKNDNIWISTLKNGVYIIPNENLKQFNSFNEVQLIKKKNDSICFLGRRNGKLLELNIYTNKQKSIFLNDKTQIRALDYNLKSKKLLYASDFQNLIYTEKAKKNNYLNKFGAIKSVAFINDFTYLISNNSGTFITNFKDKKAITSVRSHESIYSSINKKIYVADVEGLKVFDDKYHKLTNITFKNKPIYGFNIIETNNGIIWVATYDNGLLGIENNKVTIHLNSNNGLASNVINCITADNEALWISTDNGLQYYNNTLNELKVLTKQDGINSYKIRDIEVFKNQILYTNNLGVYGFDKTKIFKQKTKPFIYITNISIQGKPVEIKRKYELAHNKSSVDISFNANEFESAKHILYEYKLNKDKNWYPLREEVDFVKFISLAPGIFEFKLRAKNKFSTNYSNIVKIDFKVIAPFYQRSWFLIGSILIIIGLTIYYIQVKTKQLKKTQAKELEKERISKALVFSQLENLRSQMNPHFIFNALNSIQDYIILNEKKLARQFLVKFSRLIRIYLEHSQETNIALEDEIKALKLYLELEKDRFNDDLTFTINIDKNIRPQTTYVPSLFIQPYVENALKHGLLHKVNNKILNLNFTLNPSKTKIICVIDDNGIGRVASEKIKSRIKLPKSFATQANQKRIDLINSTNSEKIEIEIEDKKDSNNNPEGTRVIIKIPIQ